MRIVSLFFALMLFAGPAMAGEVAGVEIADTVVNEEGTTLHLNGAGTRSKFFFKIYVAGLYLENPQEQAKAAIADEGAKRVIMHFIYDKVESDKIVEAWQEGFAANLDEQAKTSLQERIDAFNALFAEDMLEGETIVFDYVPQQGTQVRVKGEVKGTIAGKDFNDALLAIWLGEEPVGSDLKKALLQP